MVHSQTFEAKLGVVLLVSYYTLHQQKIFHYLLYLVAFFTTSLTYFKVIVYVDLIKNRLNIINQLIRKRSHDRYDIDCQNSNNEYIHTLRCLSNSQQSSIDNSVGHTNNGSETNHGICVDSINSCLSVTNQLIRNSSYVR